MKKIRDLELFFDESKGELVLPPHKIPFELKLPKIDHQLTSDSYLDSFIRFLPAILFFVFLLFVYYSLF